MHCAVYTVRFILELLCGRRPDDATFAFNGTQATEYRELLALKLMDNIADSAIDAALSSVQVSKMVHVGRRKA